jgi:hypothetical protein
MPPLRRTVLFVAIGLIALVCVLNYWNQSLVFKAGRTGDTEQKIEILEKGVKSYPLNSLVFYELGKAYLDLGMRSLGEQERSSVHFQRASTCFRRSLKIRSSVRLPILPEKIPSSFTKWGKSFSPDGTF